MYGAKSLVSKTSLHFSCFHPASVDSVSFEHSEIVLTITSILIFNIDNFVVPPVNSRIVVGSDILQTRSNLFKPLFFPPLKRIMNILLLIQSHKMLRKHFFYKAMASVFEALFFYVSETFEINAFRNNILNCKDGAFLFYGDHLPF